MPPSDFCPRSAFWRFSSTLRSWSSRRWASAVSPRCIASCMSLIIFSRSSGVTVWPPCCCRRSACGWRCGFARWANSFMNLSRACFRSSVSFLISSSGALRSIASLRRSWAARRAFSASERSPSSILRAISHRRSATLVRSSSDFAARRRLAAVVSPRKIAGCGVKRSGAIRRASRAVWTRARSSSGAVTRRRRSSASARASGWLKGRAGSTISAVSVRPSCPASSRTTRVSFTRAPDQGLSVRSTSVLVSVSPVASVGSASAILGTGTSERPAFSGSISPSAEAMP